MYFCAFCEPFLRYSVYSSYSVYFSARGGSAAAISVNFRAFCEPFFYLFTFLLFYPLLVTYSPLPIRRELLFSASLICSPVTTADS